MKFRKYLAMFLALAMMAALFGCGGSQGNSGSGSGSGGSGSTIPAAETTAAETTETTVAETTVVQPEDADAGDEKGSQAEGAEAEADTETEEEDGKEEKADAAEADQNEKGGKAGQEAKGAKPGKTAGGLLGKKGSGKVEPVGVILNEATATAYDPDNYSTRARVDYVKAVLTEESAEKYPKLAKAMEDWNAKEDKTQQKTMEELLSSYVDLKQYRADIADEVTLSSEIKGSVIRADSAVVSIFHDYYIYEGGVHGYYSYGGVNFDTETGKELKFSDVVKDQARFFELTDEVFQEKYEDIYEYMTNVSEYMASQEDPEESMGWAIDSEGLTVYFNPYILGSYAMGAQSAKIYFKDHPELFVEKYTKAPESYVLPVVKNQELEIDVDGDGTRELVEVLAEPEEPGVQYSYQKWIINVGDKTKEISDSCYSEESYVVRANGQYYLYLFEVTDNDYSILGVLDLKTMDYDPEAYSLVSLAGRYSDWHDDEENNISSSWYEK
jgi:hypothetical protein